MFTCPCSDAPLAGKKAVLVGLDAPLNATLQCLLQDEGVEVQTSRWSSDTLQEQVECDALIRHVIRHVMVRYVMITYMAVRCMVIRYI